MKTIPLKQPIELKAKDTGAVLLRIDTLTMRAPEFGDLVAFDQGKGKMDGMIHLAARLAGIEVANMRKLGLEDTMQVIETVQDFLPAGLLTGPTAPASSPAPSASPEASTAGDRQS